MKSVHLLQNRITEKVLLLCCLFSLLLLVLPIYRSLPFFAQYPISNWLSLNWSPEENHYGLLLSLAGSFFLVSLCLPLILLLAWPLGWQLFHCKNTSFKALALSLLQTLNALPSVALGIWGIQQIVPLTRKLSGTGYGLIPTIFVVSIMILPTASLLFLELLRTYKRRYASIEKSLRLNFLESTVLFVKCSRSELKHLATHVFCRVFGETTLVLMLSGNSLMFPESIFSGFRTMTSSIALEMSYASGPHESALYALATLSIVLLFGLLNWGVKKDALS